MGSKADEPSLDAINQTERAYFRALGKRIAQLRRQHDMTQEDLARLLVLSQQTVYAYEAGARRVQLDLIPRLIEIFGVTCDEFLGIKPIREPAAECIPGKLMRHLGNMKRLSPADQGFIIRLAETMTGSLL